MDMKYLGCIEGQTRRAKSRNEILREAGIQNSVIQLEEKRLQWLGHVKIMGRTLILRRTLN
jgi:hypothetical protein